MPMRIEKKIWPHSPISLEECIDVVVCALQKEDSFPYPWVDRKKGELIDDVNVIGKGPNGNFLYRFREASQFNLKTIDTCGEKVFQTAREAAEYYLRHALHLPGDLDGWKVVEAKKE